MEFKDEAVAQVVKAASEGDGYRAAISQVTSDNSFVGGQWFWHVSVGGVMAVNANGIVPTRQQAEEACAAVLNLLRETHALVEEAVAEIRDPTQSAVCGSCDGSGEGSADGTRCSTCKGMGEVAA